MQLSNPETLSEHKNSKTPGLVKGNTIKAKWLGKDILSELKNIVIGELREYTEKIIEARQDALNRTINDEDNGNICNLDNNKRR